MRHGVMATVGGVLLAASCAREAPEHDTVQPRGYPSELIDIETPNAGIFGSACAATTHKSPGWKLDIYIMLDRSASMQNAIPGGYRWTSVKKALAEFVEHPMVASMGVGLQYFPPEGPSSYACSWLTYETPAVPIDLLPDNAAPLVASLEQTDADGNTPMSAALEGAIHRARNQAYDQPGRTVIVLLATDGLPTECQQGIWMLRSIAANGFEQQPSIRTFVIGVGNGLEDLHEIAAYGGTTSALLIKGSNVANDMFDAVKDIALQNVDCTFTLPKSNEVLDYPKTAIQVRPSDGSDPAMIPHVNSCPNFGDGWYFEGEAVTAETITLCADSCARVMSDPGAIVEIAVPCATT